jgi:hypothetical protein
MSQNYQNIIYTRKESKRNFFAKKISFSLYPLRAGLFREQAKIFLQKNIVCSLFGLKKYNIFF